MDWEEGLLVGDGIYAVAVKDFGFRFGLYGGEEEECVYGMFFRDYVYEFYLGRGFCSYSELG